MGPCGALLGSSVAHPTQGLIKYQGLRNWRHRLPYHNSISACAEALTTRTSVWFTADLCEDCAVVDGQRVSGRALERIAAVLDGVRSLAGTDLRARAVSENDFESGIGLGASASGFAALATAACRALSLDVDQSRLSGLARLGSASAARAVAGGVAELTASDDPECCTACQLASPDELDFAMAIVPVASQRSAEDAHWEAARSPLLAGRLAYVEGALARMRGAILARDTEEVARLAEVDTLSLHAVSMTGPAGRVLWEPTTLNVIRGVVDLRRSGLPVYFSVDTGATVYVNMPRHSVAAVTDALKQFGAPFIVSNVGGGARATDAHLVWPSDAL